jgi:branched-chain amino acid transport system permease protein
MTVGVFIAYFVARALEEAGMFQTSPVGAVVIVLVVGAVASALVALLVERFAYRPVRASGGFAPLITSIGMSFLLQQTCRGMFGSGVKAYPDPAWLQGSMSIGTFSIPYVELMVLCAAALVMAALYLVVNGTRMGTAMRATAEDPRAAVLMGIDINKVIVFTFLLGGLTAGAGGVLYALIYKQVYFMMGFLPGIKAFGAAVLGGIGSIPGAMAGGIILGLAEGVGPTLILDGLGLAAPDQLRDLFAFALLITVLICRPQGLFGEAPARRA